MLEKTLVLLASWALHWSFTLAAPHNVGDLEARADAYCNSGIYGEVLPFISPYAVAQAWWTSKWPVPCTTAPKRKRAAASSTTTTAAITITAVNNQLSAWSKALQQAQNTVKSMCYCMETTKACPSQSSLLPAVAPLQSHLPLLSAVAPLQSHLLQPPQQRQLHRQQLWLLPLAVLLPPAALPLPHRQVRPLHLGLQQPQPDLLAAPALLQPMMASFTWFNEVIYEYSTVLYTYPGVSDLATCIDLCEDYPYNSGTTQNYYAVDYSIVSRNCYLLPNTDNGGETNSDHDVAVRTNYGCQSPPATALGNGVAGGEYIVYKGQFYYNYEPEGLLPSTNTDISSLQDCLNLCGVTPNCDFLNYETDGSNDCELLQRKAGAYCTTPLSNQDADVKIN